MRASDQHKQAMLTPLRCHLVIGADSAERSNLATLLAELVGGTVHRPSDPATTYDQPLERQLLLAAFRPSVPLVVDGSHMARHQRFGFLQAVESLALEQPVRWLGWWIQPDGKVTGAERHFAPDRAEGFLHMVQLKLNIIPDLGQHCRILLGLEPQPAKTESKVVPIEASIRGASRRIQAFKLHAYSRLLDFERLIYLIQLLLHDPDLRLPEADPAQVENIEKRAARLLAIHHGHCYGDLEAVKANMKWLEKQGFQRPDLQTATIEPGPANAEIRIEQQDGVGFPSTAHLGVFQRQLGLIRYLIQCPYDQPTRSPDTTTEWDRMEARQRTRRRGHLPGLQGQDSLITQRLSGSLHQKVAEGEPTDAAEAKRVAERAERLAARDVPLRDHLLQKLEQAGVAYDGELRRFDKDIETLITPYQLRTAMGHSAAKSAKNQNRNGYALGTAVFTVDQLTNLHQLITQAFDRLKDPTLLDLKESLDERLSWSGIKLEEILPVRSFANRSIIDPEKVNAETMAADDEMLKVEHAIRERLQIRLRRTQDAASHSDKAWPLMILFHNIGWYLAYENVATRGHHGLIRISRLDRLKLQSVLDADIGSREALQRPLEDAQRAQERLRRLCKRTGGIYLGDRLDLQEEIVASKLDPDRVEQLLRKGTLVKVRFLCTPAIFTFIREGNNRFPKKQMKVSGPLVSDIWQPNQFSQLQPVEGSHPYPVELILPCWTVERDIDFRRWLFGFADGVRIEEPAELRERHLDYANSIRALYDDPAQD